MFTSRTVGCHFKSSIVTWIARFSILNFGSSSFETFDSSEYINEIIQEKNNPSKYRYFVIVFVFDFCFAFLVQVDISNPIVQFPVFCWLSVHFIGNQCQASTRGHIHFCLVFCRTYN